MAEWECPTCGFVYDEAAGLPQEGIEPGTPFDEVPPDWYCPMCGMQKDEFSPLDGQSRSSARP